MKAHFHFHIFTQPIQHRITKKETPNTIRQEDTANVKNSNEFKEYIKMTEDEETKLLELQRKYIIKYK